MDKVVLFRCVYCGMLRAFFHNKAVTPDDILHNYCNKAQKCTNLISQKKTIITKDYVSTMKTF